MRESNLSSSPLYWGSALEHLNELTFIALYIIEHIGHGAILGHGGDTLAIYS